MVVVRIPPLLFYEQEYVTGAYHIPITSYLLTQVTRHKFSHPSSHAYRRSREKAQPEEANNQEGMLSDPRGYGPVVRPCGIHWLDDG